MAGSSSPSSIDSIVGVRCGNISEGGGYRGGGYTEENGFLDSVLEDSYFLQQNEMKSDCVAIHLKTDEKQNVNCFLWLRTCNFLTLPIILHCFEFHRIFLMAS